MLFLALMQPPMAPVITSGMYEGYEEWGGGGVSLEGGQEVVLH